MVGLSCWLIERASLSDIDRIGLWLLTKNGSCLGEQLTLVNLSSRGGLSRLCHGLDDLAHVEQEVPCAALLIFHASK